MAKNYKYPNWIKFGTSIKQYYLVIKNIDVDLD